MTRWLLRLLLALLIAAVSTTAVGLAWIGIGGGSLPLHGWIALSLGVSGTVALTWGLMALAFRSSREGWDDRAGERPPAPTSERDKP
ncbi:MAG: hypothetical protein ACXW3O_04645 [Brevundimonas sp.]